MYNDNLTTLSGLNNLTLIGGLGLDVRDNQLLTNISGLENLTTVGYCVFISSNDNLLSLSGLDNLNSIALMLAIGDNPQLTDLSSLGNLTSVGGSISIGNNFSLPSLTGLDNVDANSINQLNIVDNYSLSHCDVQSICDYLAAPSGTIEIHGNAIDCNSPEEVQTACLTSIEDNVAKEVISLSPNPATTFITINVNGGMPIEEATIYNHLGQKVLVAVLVNNTVDVSKLKPGIYFIEVATKEWRGRTKLIIE